MVEGDEKELTTVKGQQSRASNQRLHTGKKMDDTKGNYTRQIVGKGKGKEVDLYQDILKEIFGNNTHIRPITFGIVQPKPSIDMGV